MLRRVCCSRLLLFFGDGGAVCWCWIFVGAFRRLVVFAVAVWFRVAGRFVYTGHVPVCWYIPGIVTACDQLVQPGASQSKDVMNFSSTDFR